MRFVCSEGFNFFQQQLSAARSPPSCSTGANTSGTDVIIVEDVFKYHEAPHPPDSKPACDPNRESLKSYGCDMVANKKSHPYSTSLMREASVAGNTS